MPRLVTNPGMRIETLPSHSDSSVPLVSIHTPHWGPTPDLDDPDDKDAIPTEPRPRPSLQIYYTAPLTHPTELITVAHTLETAVLSPNDRFNTASGANYERLDVYSLPVPSDMEEAAAPQDCFRGTLADADGAVQRCVAHQRAEIAARENDPGGKGKEWYIQRYDVPKGKWRRAIVVIRTPVAGWEWGSEEKTGRGLVLSTVMFDPTEDGAEPGEVLVCSGATEGDIRVTIDDMRSELNWQWGYVQFLY